MIQAQYKRNTRWGKKDGDDASAIQVECKHNTSRIQARWKRDEKINMGGEEKCNDTSAIQVGYKVPGDRINDTSTIQVQYKQDTSLRGERR